MRRIACILLAPLALAIVLVGTAWAADAAPATRPTQAPVEGDAGEPRLALRPIRFRPQSADPGDTLRFTLTATNATQEDVAIAPSLLPVEGSTNPEEYATIGSARSRAKDALAWATFPQFGEVQQLRAGHQLKFPVVVQVPADAAPGSYALAMGFTVRVSALAAETVDAPAGRVRLQAGPSSVAVIRVTGEAVSDARLRSIDAPRLVWGGDQPRFRARIDNVGDTDLVIDGKVDLDAFFGTASRTLDARGPKKGQPTLPGGTRIVEMRWSDPPLLGWFQPELVVVGGKGSGVRITKDLETVYVLPPWWLILLVAVALWLPLRARRRRRRDPEHREAQGARARANVEKRLARERARRRAEEARRGRR